MKKQTRIEKYLGKLTSLKGKTYIVTGANSGLGYSATKHLLSLGAHVVMACRNLNKASLAKDSLIKLYPNGTLSLFAYDQADFESIETFALAIKENVAVLDGIVLNAGLYHPKKGLKTKQGLPLTMGTNYMGVYYLLKALERHAIFKKNPHMRIIFVGSLSWHHVKVKKIKEQLSIEKGNLTDQYARSKTAIGKLAYFLSRHIENDYLFLNSSIKVLIMHPGVTGTNIVGAANSSMPKWIARIAPTFLNIFTHTPDVAALGIIKLLATTEVDENKLVAPRGLFQISGYPRLKHYPYNLRKDGPTLLKTSEEVIATIEHKK